MDYEPGNGRFGRFAILQLIASGAFKSSALPFSNSKPLPTPTMRIVGLHDVVVQLVVGSPCLGGPVVAATAALQFDSQPDINAPVSVILFGRRNRGTSNKVTMQNEGWVRGAGVGSKLGAPCVSAFWAVATSASTCTCTSSRRLACGGVVPSNTIKYLHLYLYLLVLRSPHLPARE